MRFLSLLVLAGVLGISLGGCFGLGDEPAYVPRTHEFDLYVEQALSGVIGLYPRNDNSTQGAVAITFKANPDDPQAVPGPEIRVKEGDTVILRLHNPNGLAHTIHLHGDPGKVAWESDGVDYLTQMPVRQGEEYVYTYRDLKAGTYWYHCHVDGAHHIDFGMYGAFIVEEVEPKYHHDRDYVVFLDEFDSCHVHGNTDPVFANGSLGQEPSADYQAQSDCYYRFLQDNLAQNQLVTTTGQVVGGSIPQEARDAYCPAMLQAFANVPEPYRSNALVAAGCQPPHSHGTPPVQQRPREWWYETHPLYNPTYNTFVVNGKAFPDSPVFPVREGEVVRFRIINAGNFVHTWHPHGHTMQVITKDGYPLAGGMQEMDTLAIAPGERYDYLMEMDNPGLWMIHDQMGQYAVNDNVHPGGMMTCFAYDGFRGVDAFAMSRALDCNTEAVRILGEHGQHTGHAGH